MNSNRVISILLLIISCYIFFVANGYPIRSTAEPGAGFFPKVISIILAFLAILLFFQKPFSHSEDPVQQKKFEKNDFIRFLLVFLAFVLLIIIAPHVGFFIASSIFIITWMVLMKEKNWTFILILAFGFSIGITLLFEKLLGVPIPHGFIY